MEKVKFDNICLMAAILYTESKSVTFSVGKAYEIYEQVAADENRPKSVYEQSLDILVQTVRNG